jgi:phage regulator Rha-like protein
MLQGNLNTVYLKTSSVHYAEAVHVTHSDWTASIGDTARDSAPYDRDMRRLTIASKSKYLGVAPLRRYFMSIKNAASIILQLRHASIVTLK